MSRPSSFAALRRTTLAFAFLGISSSSALAQANTGVPSQQGATNRKDPGALKVLNLQDYGRWNRITSTAISPDGKWMTYTLQPNDGDATLFVKLLDGDKVYSVNAGTAPAAGRGDGGGGFGAAAANGPAFSDDSRFIGYYLNSPGSKGRGRGAQGGRGGRGGAGAAVAAEATARRFELLDLESGAKVDVPNAASFKFAKGGHWLAVRTNKAVADTTHDGADLLLRDLSSGASRNVGNVNQYDFDDSGRLLAYTIDAAEHLGNGVYLIDLASGGTKTLDGAAQIYDQVQWSADGSNLAVLRGTKASDKKQRDNVLLTWSEPGTPKSMKVEYDPSKDASFPKMMVLSEYSSPRFSRDGSRVFVGIKQQDAETAKSDVCSERSECDPQANVDVWHWKDPDPQSVQMIRIQQLRRTTTPASIVLATKRFVKLGSEDMTQVVPTANGKWAIGRDDSTYRGEVAWGGGHADYYRVNTETGERTLIERTVVRTMGTSPDSKWFLYLKDKHVKAVNLETMKTVDLDDGEKLSFVDVDDDHPYELPTYGVAGWSKDGKYVLLNHKYDVWAIPLDGGKAIELTQGVGTAQQIQFRVVRLDRRAGRGGRGGGIFGTDLGGDDDEGLDLSKPVLLSAYGEWTKKTGYWTASFGKAPVPLVFADKQIGQAQKAEKADRVVFTEQTFKEFPDYWVSTTAFASPRKVTDANPQLNEYAWGSKVLIEYTNGKGKKLQGTLTLPAGYQPGKKYPMLVYFYEIMSNTHHTFSMPVYDDRPHISTYASNGYLVLQPDVVYEIGKPGSSAVDCVESAVKKVIELGYADPQHIGLQGHSWGGYESSYILTRSKLFAAVVTGAPPTDLISFYDETYPGTGTLQQGIMELGQVRMGDGATPWTAKDLYEDQSPIFHVRDISTPFLILHGTADNAVDWHQGLEFYGAARRWGKHVILLSYPGEPHHLARKENQKDFQIRMKQFFDHYLMDKPEPKWMSDGVPQVKKGEPIE
ncbi:MAG TPA: prolyl oligopeptidase family serine peptidase [Gemmatimonadaceae bacterium]|jgi:dienelactone hydrolase